MWAENRSKRLHDPLAMKDKSVVKPKTKVGETLKKGRRKAASVISRPTLPKGMNYVIKKIPAHPLRFGAVFNFDFANEIKKSITEEGVEMFKNTIFGLYLNIPKCNFQGQITKCLLLLEVQHENKDLLHVRHANGTVLQFSIKDFAIVTGLKCKGNVKDFSYPESTTSRLLQRYFPDVTAGITKSRLIQRFQMGNWETTQDVVHMAILYFAHSLMLCQLGETSIQIKEFLMVEDSRKSSRVSGTSSPPPPKRRNKIDTSKTKVSKPKSSELLRPPINQSFPMPDETPTPAANVSCVHVSSQGQKVKSVYPDIEELKQHMKDYVDNKFEYLVTLIKANHTELMNSRHREDDQQPKDLAGKSTTCMVEVSGKEGNDGHQQVPLNQSEDTLKNHQEMKDISELQSSYENIHHTAETTKHKKDDASGQMPQHFFEGTMNEDASDKVQHNTNQSVPDPITFDTSDSMTSGTISSETREAMDTLIADIGRLPIPTKPICAVNLHELTVSQNFLSDSQLPTDIPITAIVVRSDTNTPLARNRMPSQILKSPYLASFRSSEKGKEVMEDVTRPYFQFEGCAITNRTPDFLIDEYIQWVTVTTREQPLVVTGILDLEEV
ncbi:hypothetical protein KY285_015764 [Solanum tuberosum]|nr:hypothetical protein KY285_015764 [Solanum tuberosum]